jgi:hypothetical protein
MIKSIKLLLETISPSRYWVGKAYRSASGYSHEKGATAGDVVRYEQDELGNDYGITKEGLRELDKHPARDLIWVTKKKSDARRYGDPNLINVEGWRIVAEDGDGGFLVLNADR